MLKRLEQGLVLANKSLLIIFMSVMFALVFLNVVTRYVFDFSLNWAEELSRYLMIWTAYLGMGIAMLENRHVAIDMLQDRLPAGARKALRAVNGAILIASIAALTYLGFRYSIFAWHHETASLQLSVGLMYLTIPIGSIMFILYMITSFRDYVERPPMADQPSEASPVEEEGA